MSSSQVSLTALESQCLLLLHWSSGAHHISSGLKQKIVVITSIEILGQSHSIQFGFQQFVSRHSKLQDSPLNLPCLLLCYRSVGCILKFNLNLLGSCGTWALADRSSNASWLAGSLFTRYFLLFLGFHWILSLQHVIITSVYFAALLSWIKLLLWFKFAGAWTGWSRTTANPNWGDGVWGYWDLISLGAGGVCCQAEAKHSLHK